MDIYIIYVSDIPVCENFTSRAFSSKYHGLSDKAIVTKIVLWKLIVTICMLKHFKDTINISDITIPCQWQGKQHVASQTQSRQRAGQPHGVTARGTKGSVVHAACVGAWHHVCAALYVSIHKGGKKKRFHEM